MQYDDNNRGAAFPRQSDNPKAPKFSGPVKIDGKEYEVSIWEQTSKGGKDYLALKFGPPWQPKEKTGNYNAPKPAAPRTTDEPATDDDIPF
jgi:uncharacterized protein (DUF736 family)